MSYCLCLNSRAFQLVLRTCLEGRYACAINMLGRHAKGHGIGYVLSAIIAKTRLHDTGIAREYAIRAIDDIAPGINKVGQKALIEKVWSLLVQKKDDTQKIEPSNILLGNMKPNEREIVCVYCYDIVVGWLLRYGLLSKFDEECIVAAGGQTDIILFSDDEAVMQQIIALTEIIKVVPLHEDELKIPHQEISQVGGYFETVQAIRSLAKEEKYEEANRLCLYAICKVKFERCKTETEKILMYQGEILRCSNTIQGIEESVERYTEVLNLKKDFGGFVEMTKTEIEPINPPSSHGHS
jgi:hypothetical protein